MNNASAIVEFQLFEAFDTAIRRVRTTLAGQGLSITGELDISKRLADTMVVVLPRCRVLFVQVRASPPLLDCFAAALLPLHIVVAGNDVQTTVYVQSCAAPGGSFGLVRWAPLVDTHREAMRALASIAVRSCAR